MNRKSLILIVIVILSLAGYGYTYIQVSSAIQDVDITIWDFYVVGISLFPPSADVVFVYLANNPSGYEIELRVDGAIYYGNTFITPIEVHDTLRANGRSTFDLAVQLTSGSIIGVLVEGGDPQFTFEGEVTAIHRIFGIIPVVFTTTGSF